MSLRKPLRKPHKKSRLGCQECKRRHIKCDEARPTCDNCLTNSRACIYQSPPSRTVQPPSVSLTHPTSPAAAKLTGTTSVTTAPSPASVGLISQLSTPSTLTASLVSPSQTATSSAQYGALYPPLNMRHMELFSHFIFDTAPSLDERRPCDREYLRIMMPAALSAPYVVHQMLALSALHLSHTRVAQAEYHREEAMALQTQAISLFNVSRVEITTENCAPMLIFSSFLGLYALAEAVTAGETDAGGFLDRFVTYLNLHRGVRAVTEQSWQLLRQSNISSILDRAERSLDAAFSPSQEQATIVADRLHRLLNDADIGTDSKLACRDAVSRLQLVYQSELLEGEITLEEHSTGLIWTWPVLLSGVFIDLLMKRRPEALLILCHYAVLLHQRRSMWLVRNAGRMLIEEITRFLGTYWRDWLEWPNQVLGKSS